MNQPRRQVRVDESFFEQQFATGFDALPEVIVGVPSARMLINAGRLVARFVVYGLESADGSIDVIGIDLEH